jgi:hypothetical protein
MGLFDNFDFFTRKRFRKLEFRFKKLEYLPKLAPRGRSTLTSRHIIHILSLHTNGVVATVAVKIGQNDPA